MEVIKASYEKHEKLYHLWRTEHLDFTNEKKWHNSGKYKGAVNNTSGCYYTNESADKIAEHANNAGVTESELFIEPSYKYYKKLRNR